MTKIKTTKINQYAKTLQNKLVLLVLLVVTFMQVTTGTSRAAATVPFECSNFLYIGSSVDNDPTQFKIVNDGQDPFVFNNLATLSALLNAFGFRVQDGFVYGFKDSDPDKNSLYKIDSNGDETDLGVPTGYPAATAPDDEGTFAGDFANDGLHYTIHRTDAGNALVATNVVAVTSTVIDADLGIRTADIAYNPKTDLFYGYDASIDRFFTLTTTGTVTHFGPTYSFGANGAAWFDPIGNYFSYENLTGTIRQVNIDLANGQLGAILRSVSGPIVDDNDGTSCPYSPYISKTASPRTVQQNGVVTYTYQITNNHFSDIITANFVDNLSDSRTFVAGSLTSDAGGTVGSYGGTNTLSISNISVPANTTRTLTVNVQIPADYPIGNATNQAFLQNVTGDFNPTAIYSSDDTATIIRGDTTDISVIAGDVIPGAPNAGFKKSKNYLIFIGALLMGALAIPLIKKYRQAKA